MNGTSANGSPRMPDWLFRPEVHVRIVNQHQHLQSGTDESSRVTWTLISRDSSLAIIIHPQGRDGSHPTTIHQRSDLYSLASPHSGHSTSKYILRLALCTFKHLHSPEDDIQLVPPYSPSFRSNTQASRSRSRGRRSKESRKRR